MYQIVRLPELCPGSHPLGELTALPPDSLAGGRGTFPSTRTPLLSALWALVFGRAGLTCRNGEVES